MATIKKVFTPITKKQSVEFGLVAVLVTIFLALYLKENSFVMAAFIITLITIIAPGIFYPFAVCWFGIAEVLGVISSAIMMGIVFFLVVVPIGLFRRVMGKDSLKIRVFKKGKQSVMTDRNHLYTGTDLLHTF